jgi:hypothetical protein
LEGFEVRAPSGGMVEWEDEVPAGLFEDVEGVEEGLRG